MSKNWLIRTQSKQILGPVSREKILELLEKSMLHDDDEICSGNGYWFYIKESNLIEKYLQNQVAQPFNPVSEAKDVLNGQLNQAHDEQEQEDSATEHTMVLNVPGLQEEAQELEDEKSGPLPTLSTANEKKK